MTDLRRIRYVTEHYGQLQGLRLLPLSVPFLVAAGRRLLGAPAIPWRLWALIAAASIATTVPIGRYYTRRFGRVRARAWQSAAPLVGVLGMLLCLLVAQDAVSAPISLPLAYLVIVFARLGLLERRVRVHYVGIAAVILAFALLPRFGVPFDLRTIIGHLLAAGSIAVAAIGDDRVLRRTLTMNTNDEWRTA